MNSTKAMTLTGVVVYSQFDPLGGWSVKLRHKNGFSTYDAHMNQQSKVRRGQVIARAGYLGPVGNTGDARFTVTHLHFGLYVNGGGAINPLPYLKNAEGRYAWATMAAIAFAESSFFPIPPDIVMIPMALTNRALALIEIDRWDDATKLIDSALELNPNLARALFQRARIRRQLGQLADAEADGTLSSRPASSPPRSLDCPPLPRLSALPRVRLAPRWPRHWLRAAC